MLHFWSEQLGNYELDFEDKWGFILDNKKLKDKCRKLDIILDLIFNVIFVVVFISITCWLCRLFYSIVGSDFTTVNSVEMPTIIIMVCFILFKLVLFLTSYLLSFIVTILFSLLPTAIIIKTKEEDLEKELVEYGNTKKSINDNIDNI